MSLDAKKRTAHLLALLVPPAGVALAIVLLWEQAVDARDIALLAGLYAISGFGVTVGFHRLLTHRAFACHRPTSYALAVCGSLALQGSVIDWVSDHRKHHAHPDEEGDPHSPHLGDSPWRSFWHAHAGWLFTDQGRSDHERYAPDLLEDRGMRAIDRAWPGLAALSLLLPLLLGGLTGLIWGGLVRVFLFHHATFSINSICHLFGRRRFATEDRSTNVAWLSPFSLGESWHHNHHAFPRSALHGLRWYELDLSGLLIRAMAGLGLAWNVVRIAPERQEERLAET